MQAAVVDSVMTRIEGQMSNYDQRIQKTIEDMISELNDRFATS